MDLTDATFEKTVLNSDETFVVDFYADWCGPCQVIAPFLEQICQEMEGKIKLGKLDVEINPLISTRFQIRSLPTLIIFKAGQIFDSRIGAGSKNDLKKWIDASVS